MFTTEDGTQYALNGTAEHTGRYRPGSEIYHQLHPKCHDLDRVRAATLPALPAPVSDSTLMPLYDALSQSMSVGLRMTVRGSAELRVMHSNPAPALCHHFPVSLDPTVSNPDHYKVVFENERVRVLEYRDQPGERTTPHAHPDSVMYTLSAFRRRLVSGDVQREVELDAGSIGWLPAQEHHGENIGETPTHVLFVELKDTGETAATTRARIGPAST